MRISRFSELRVVGVLKEYDAGANVSDLCRKHGISTTTLYKWKNRYGGLNIPGLRYLKKLEAENSELKRLLADAKLDISGLKGLLAKNLPTPSCRRTAAKTLIEEFRFTERRSCRLAGISRSSFRYEARPDRHVKLRKRLVELANKHRQLGYRKLHAMLFREGFHANAKLVARLYREEGLTLRRIKRKKNRRRYRQGAWCPIKPDYRWSLDFTEDVLSNGRKIRSGNLKDDCTRECLALDVEFSFPGTRVVAMLDRVVMERGRVAKIITVDNGSEFRGHALGEWAASKGVQLQFIDPGMPTQNPYIESFNARFRIECLNLHLFDSINTAREIIERWRRHYNEERPHQSLGYATPAEFAAKRHRLLA